MIIKFWVLQRIEAVYLVFWVMKDKFRDYLALYQLGNEGICKVSNVSSSLTNAFYFTMLKIKIFEYPKYNTLVLIGPLAVKKINFHKEEKISYNNGFFVVEKNHTLQSLLNNLKTSLVEGYQEFLHLVGVGYKFEILNPSLLKIYVGFTNDILVTLPSEFNLSLINPTLLKVSGSSKFEISNFVNKIRDIKPGYKDRYKNKGIHVGKPL